MFCSKQILVSTLALGVSVLNLAGCGQTGALYLPPPSTAPATTPAPASISAQPPLASPITP